MGREEEFFFLSLSPLRKKESVSSAERFEWHLLQLACIFKEIGEREQVLKINSRQMKFK